MKAALRGLHRRRRLQRLRHLDWVDALYRAYLVGIVGVAALAALAALVGDGRLAVSTVTDVARSGPAIAGLAVAVLMALGLRSGANGGPFAFEAADVQHVLLAPIDRGLVVRAAAFRQLRGVVTMGAVAGAVVGAVAGPRFSKHGGDTVGWIAADAVFGVVVGLAVWGSAVLASTRGLRRGPAALTGAALMAWSGVDLALGTTTSPLTMLGRLALPQITETGVAAVGVAAVGVLVAVGLRGAGRLSLEPVLQRARLVSALRFAATVQDLRAVITLRRQLSAEASRSRPWFRLRPAPPTGRATWRRDWQGMLRWPGARVARVAALTFVGAAGCVGALRGTTPMLALAPIAAYVIALDVIEGFAQEIDHPDRGSGLPESAGTLYVSHLAAPFALMGFLAAVGLGAGLLIAAAWPATGSRSIPLMAGVAVAVALTVIAPTAASLSVYLGRPDRDLSMAIVHPGFVAAQQFGPVVLVALAFIPLLVAREVHPPTDPAGAALSAAVPALAAALAIRAFLAARRGETE